MSWFSSTERREKSAPSPTRRAVASGPVLRRSCACEHSGSGGGCEECKKKKKQSLHRSVSREADVDQIPPIVYDVLRSPGAPLDPATRRFFEPRFGQDLSRVRVHTDVLANRSAASVNAFAYTVGEHVVFAEGRHPSEPRARELLAHELTHTIQHGRFESLAGLQIGSASSEVEREARDNEASLSSDRPLRVNAPAAGARLNARGPMPAPVRPPVRAPARPAAGRGQARQPGEPGVRGPHYVPDPSDTSLDAMFARAAIARSAEQAKWELEQPIATLQRGGTAPDFVTRGRPQVAAFEWGNVTYEPHNFHILDAIEYEVSRANSDEDLADILDEYIPSPTDALLRSPSGFPRGRLRPRKLFGPIIPRNFDSRGDYRMLAYKAALDRRTQTVPALGSGRAAPAKVPSSVEARGCQIRPIRGLGGDPLASLFCQAATNSMFSYWIESPMGRAEIDALRGSTWYECKCGYASLVRAVREGRPYAERRLSDLDEQALRHSRIAAHCGLTYRFMVSNEEFADFLRNRWFSIPVDVVRFEPCD